MRPPVGVSSPVRTQSIVSPSGSPSSRHELLDQLALVPEAEDEAVKALVGVDADDVPEDRTPADLDERLRDRVRLFAQPGAPAAAEDHDGLVHRRERY